MTRDRVSSVRGQSKVVGVLLMVGVALVLVGGLGVFVFDITGGSDSPSLAALEISPTEDGTAAVIEHVSGDAIDTADLRITVEDELDETTFDATGMDVFSVGDRLVVDDRILTGETTITVVYEPTPSVIAEETLTLGELFELTGNTTYELPGRGVEIPAEGVNVTVEKRGIELRSTETDENGEFGLVDVPNESTLKVNGKPAIDGVREQDRVPIELINDTESVDSASDLPGLLMENLTESGAPIYAVETASDLQTMNISNDIGFRLVSDIDASHTATWDGGNGFVPVENNPRFNGSGHVIDGLTIDRPGEDNVGLFRTTDPTGGTSPSVSDVRNVGLENVDITGGNSTGAVAGRLRSSLVSGSVVNSYATGSVDGENFTGGVVGAVNANSVSKSYADVKVSGNEGVGGLVGGGGSKYSVTDSYAIGTASGNASVGGLVGSGQLRFGSSTPLPDQGQIETSFAATSVSGAQDVGGILGERGGNLNFTNGTEMVDTYWDVDVSGQTEPVGNESDDGATGLNTTEMQGSAASSNLNGFDFGNVWETVSGEYPILRTFGG